MNVFEKVSFAILLFSIAFLIHVGFGCQSPYPPCNAAGVYRCNGQIVELCNGSNWQPRTDCADVWLDGDQRIDAQCVEAGSVAECELR